MSPVKSLPITFRPRPVTALLLSAALALLTACGQAPSRPTAATDQAAAQANLQQARQSGDLLALAEAHWQVADTQTGQDALESRLRAVETAIDGGHFAPAENYLQQLGGPAAIEQPGSRRQLLQAFELLMKEQHYAALDRLQAIQPPLPEDQANRRLRLLAHTFDALGFHMDAARNLIALQQRAAVPEEHFQAIWTQLEQLPSIELTQAALATQDEDVLGWLELQHLMRDARHQPQSLQADLQAWQQRFGQHPLAGHPFLSRLAEEVLQERLQPQRIALLLPNTGRYAAAAEAFREGFVNAYYQTPAEQRAELVLRTTDGDARTIWQHYQSAVDAGADLIIGPLDKASVEAVSLAPEHPIPTLVLNYSENLPMSANLYQFGLLPEDEATQAAELAARQDYLHCAVLYPRSDWGGRMNDAFRQSLERFGGQVLASTAYSPDRADYGNVIQRLLELDHSEQRRQSLTRLLGKKLAFEPRRRQDIDAIFLPADAEEARAIRPQLRFHYAGDIPVIATSQAHEPGKGPDNDLDGLIFSEMPWLGTSAPAEKQQLQQAWPELADSPLTRLHAMGLDAYRLIPHLGQMRKESAETLIEAVRQFSLDGMTGRLGMDAAGRIHRQLDWYTFSRGRAQPLDTGL